MSSSVTEIITIDSQPVEPKPDNPYIQLLTLAVGALSFFPPMYFRSIFGSPLQWLPPHRKNSEYNILSVYRPIRTFKYLVDVTVPAFNHEPGPWVQTFVPPVVKNLFWRPSTYFSQPDPFFSCTSFIKEDWFFINGICTNTDVAKMNTDHITNMFMRPLTCIQNQTASFWLDLYQCALGKGFKTDPKLTDPQTMTEPAIKETVAILHALLDDHKEKVVLLCHSQGTIITANLLRALKRYASYLKYKNEPPTMTENMMDSLVKQAFDPKMREISDQINRAKEGNTTDQGPVVKAFRNNQLIKLKDLFVHYVRKLEVYTFANCATDMTYIDTAINDDGKRYGFPYIENFANQFDLVARLGVISPYSWDKNSNIQLNIDGDVYEKTGYKAWGHLLNEHYLFGMPVENPLTGEVVHEPEPGYKRVRTAQYSPVQDQPKPRLYEYLVGGSPVEDYWDKYSTDV